MSKYTDEELREMAREVLRARDNNDARYVHLVIVMSQITNLSPDDILERIIALAGLESR